MAIVFPAWIRYVAHIKPHKLVQLAVRVFDADVFTNTEEEIALALADTLEEYFDGLGLRTHLSQLDITGAYFNDMAIRGTRNGSVGHYVPIDKETFIKILNIAL